MAGKSMASFDEKAQKHQSAENIMEKQRQPEMVQLLWARDRVCQQSKVIQGLYVTATVILPIVSAFIFSGNPGSKPFTAGLGLLLLILEIAFLDKLLKGHLKRNAQMQEEYDTYVLGLPWHEFVAGEKVAPEDIYAAATKTIPPTRKSQLESWYAAVVAQAPQHIGRLVCQRTNINYDARQRKRYANYLLGSTLLLCVAIFILALASDAKPADFFMTYVMPVSPLLAWSVRERNRHISAAELLVGLQSKFKAVWKTALEGASDEELEIAARKLQDNIFQHRASSPMVFDWAYNLFRKHSEQEANHAAAQLVNEAKVALNIGAY